MGGIGGKLVGGGVDIYPAVVEADFVQRMIVKGLPLEGDACGNPRRDRRSPRQGCKKRGMLVTITLRQAILLGVGLATSPSWPCNLTAMAESSSSLRPERSSALNFGSF